MKKILKAFLIGLMTLILIAGFTIKSAFALPEIAVTVHYGNGEEKTVNLPGKGGELPRLSLTALAQLLGANVAWQAEEKTAVWAANDLGVVFCPNLSTVRVINSQSELLRYTWPERAQIIDGRMCLPPSLIEFLGIVNFWDETNETWHLYLLDENISGGNTSKVWQVAKEDLLEELATLPRKITSYTTKFDPNNKARTTNLKIAAAALHGLPLSGSHIFSFNDSVGERTAEKGYQMAIIYLNGNKVEDYGGGICQVSSTLYNAALAAGLEIVERHPHSLPVDYVPENLDATVSWGSKDLKIFNDTEEPMHIRVHFTEDSLTISLWSGYFAP